MEREIVGWRFLLGTTDGLTIAKMGFYIRLILPSACSRGVISLRSVEWGNLTAKMKLLWICLLALDTSRCLSLSSMAFSNQLLIQVLLILVRFRANCNR